MNEEYLPRDRQSTRSRDLYDFLEAVTTAFACVILLMTFAVRMVGVVGPSMSPTLQSGDRLITTSRYSQLQGGDIVVVTMPNDRNEPLIKRVIATGGQTIYISPHTGAVYVDGEALSESYISEPIAPNAIYRELYPQVVPPGHIFVLGDNRNNSWDSRSPAVGMVDERYVLGKVIYRVLPRERAGGLE